MRILLGISLTLNVISAIIFFIIYKYSLKKVIKKIQEFSINNFLGDNIDIRGVDLDDYK